MGYINTRPIEETIRELFRQKGTATFLEMVEAGFPLWTNFFTYASETGEGTREQNLQQYETELDATLRNYFHKGLIYPAQWRALLEDFIGEARVPWRDDLPGGPIIGAIEFHSNARVQRVLGLIDGWWVTPRHFEQELASAVCRALN